MPNTYEGTFSVNGIRTTERVVANDQTSAKKLMEMRYPGAKINFHLECKSLTNLYIFTFKI